MERSERRIKVNGDGKKGERKEGAGVNTIRKVRGRQIEMDR